MVRGQRLCNEAIKHDPEMLYKINLKKIIQTAWRSHKWKQDRQMAYNTVWKLVAIPNFYHDISSKKKLWIVFSKYKCQMCCADWQVFDYGAHQKL